MKEIKFKNFIIYKSKKELHFRNFSWEEIFLIGCYFSKSVSYSIKFSGPSKISIDFWFIAQFYMKFYEVPDYIMKWFLPLKYDSYFDTTPNKTGEKSLIKNKVFGWVSYHRREISLAFHHYTMWWCLYLDDDEWKCTDPKWRRSNWGIDDIKKIIGGKDLTFYKELSLDMITLPIEYKDATINRECLIRRYIIQKKRKRNNWLLAQDYYRYDLTLPNVEKGYINRYDALAYKLKSGELVPKLDNTDVSFKNEIEYTYVGNDTSCYDPSNGKISLKELISKIPDILKLEKYKEVEAPKDLIRKQKINKFRKLCQNTTSTK